MRLCCRISKLAAEGVDGRTTFKWFQIASGGNRHAHARRTRLSGAVTLAKGSSIARRFHDHEDGRLSLVRQRRPCVDQGDQISVRMAGVLRLTAGAIAGSRCCVIKNA